VETGSHRQLSAIAEKVYDDPFRIFGEGYMAYGEQAGAVNSFWFGLTEGPYHMEVQVTGLKEAHERDSAESDRLLMTSEEEWQEELAEAYDDSDIEPIEHWWICFTKKIDDVDDEIIVPQHNVSASASNFPHGPRNERRWHPPIARRAGTDPGSPTTRRSRAGRGLSPLPGGTRATATHAARRRGATTAHKSRVPVPPDKPRLRTRRWRRHRGFTASPNTCDRGLDAAAPPARKVAGGRWSGAAPPTSTGPL
jgi:hypothetical protein